MPGPIVDRRPPRLANVLTRRPWTSPSRFAGDLDVRDVVAAVDRALVVLAAALDPLHRPAADRLAREHHERHVGVAEDLGAEGAAHVRADAPDLVLRDPGHERRQQQPLDVRRLARHPDRVLVGARVVPADVAPDLHRVRDQAVVHQALLDDDLGVRERGVGPVLVARPSTRTRCCWARSRGAAGAPGWVAFSASTTAGSGSQSTSISSSASCAWAGRLGDDGRDALAGPLHVVGREDPRRVDVVLEPGRRRPPARPSAAGCTGCPRR